MRTKYKILALSLMMIILTAITCMTMNISAATTPPTTMNAVTVTWGTNTRDYTSLANAISGINNNSTYTTYTIKLNNDVTITSNIDLPNKPTIITAATDKILTIRNGYSLTAQADVTFKNITIKGDEASLFGSGKTIIFDDSVRTTSSNSYVFSYVYGGFKNTNTSAVSNIIIYSGIFYEVYGGGYSTTTKTTVSSSNIVVYGGNIEYLFAGGYGANATVATANTTIAGGNIRTVYAGGYNSRITASNITYIGGNITNSITDVGAAKAYGYLVADTDGNYPASPFKSNEYNDAYKNLFKIGKGFTKTNSTNFSLLSMQVNFDSSKFTTSSLQYYDETSGTWKNWSANIYTETGNYELRLRATGYAKDDTGNKNIFTFEQTVKFFVWDGATQPLLEYIFGILLKNSVINQMFNPLTSDPSIINTILNWLFGGSGMLNNLSMPTSEIAYSNDVYDKLTNLDQWSGSFDDFMESITDSSPTIVDEPTDSNSKIIDIIKDRLNNIESSTIIENIINNLRKRYNP